MDEIIVITESSNNLTNISNIENITIIDFDDITEFANLNLMEESPNTENTSTKEISLEIENFEDEKNEVQIIEPQILNSSNCLALTIQKDHKIAIIKNLCTRSIRMTFKIIFSSIGLTILKFFT